MHIEIDSTARIAKAFTQKREKKKDDTEVVIGHLKFTGCFVSRETLDEFLNRPIGWSIEQLYDLYGMPVVRAEIALPFFEAELTGVIRGTNQDQNLTISKALMGEASLALAKMGAYLSGEITWEIAGDESSILVPLQGNECGVHFVLQDAGQKDLLAQATEARNELTKEVKRVVIFHTDDSALSDEEPLLEQAKTFVLTQSTITISKLQRELQLGYNRAARMLERLEKIGVVGELRGDGTRAVIKQETGAAA